MSDKTKTQIVVLLFYALSLLTFCYTKNEFSIFITFLAIPVGILWMECGNRGNNSEKNKVGGKNDEQS